MFWKKLSILSAAAYALVLGVMLSTPVVSPAVARNSARIPARPAPQLVRLRFLTSPSRADAGYGRLLPTGAAEAGSQPRIVGGNDGAPGDWAFMAFIAHFDAYGNPDFLCSGSIVAPNIILTAAHCAVAETTQAPLDPAGFRVVTGSLDWTDMSPRQISDVSEVITDFSYEPETDTFDDALLVLSTPTTAPAIALASGGDAYLRRAGTEAFIAGWGATYNGDPDLQSYLQWAPAVVQQSGYCAGFDPNFDSFSELCAVNPPQLSTGTCVGDSGGPLVAYTAAGTPVDIGITTHGPTDCNTSTADYFTAIGTLYPWLTGWIQQLGSAPPPTQPPVSVPLPAMALAAAKRYVRQTLAGGLGQRARPANSLTTKCVPKAATRFRCGVAFWHGPNDYYGRVAVFYVKDSAGLVKWTDTYTIHWVNEHCYYHSGHPSQCAIYTRRGTW